MPNPPNPELASCWRRLLAFAVDLLVLLPGCLIMAWCWINVFQIRLPAGRLPLFDYLTQLHLQHDPLVLGGLLVLIFLVGGYFLVGHLLGGTSVGMRLLGIAVVPASGEDLGMGTATARVLSTLLSAAYFLLGFLWIAFDDRRQGLHDKIADTLVIRRNAR